MAGARTSSPNAGTLNDRPSNIDACFIAKTPQRINQPDYLEQFNLLVSARLNKIIFGMLHGIPVIPIEGQMFRLSGIMQDMRYPLPTVRIGQPDWQSVLEANLQRARKNPEDLRASILAGVEVNADRLEAIAGSALGTNI